MKSRQNLPQVSIIVVNLNGKGLLPMCLESLQAQTYTHFEVILVDNGSTDGSGDLVRQRYPWVKLVTLPDNVGFASGNNIGFEHASGAYIVTLNNDTKVDRNWLQELVWAADSNPAVGMVASRVVSFAEPDTIDSLGMLLCRDGMSRGAYRLQRFSTLPLGSIEDIFFPSACAALYKRTMLEQIGFFDDDFFAYCEDTDLGIRGRLAGWEAVVATKAITHHKYSQSGGTFSPFKLYLVERNHYWMVFKNFPLQRMVLLPYYTFLRYATQTKVVVSSHGAGHEFLSSASRSACLKAILKGTYDAFVRLPAMYRKRKHVRTLKKLSQQQYYELMKTYQLSFKELLDAG